MPVLQSQRQSSTPGRRTVSVAGSALGHIRGNESVHTHSDRLRVFISSRMQELKDVRAILRQKLEELGIDAFVYEVDLGAHPDDPEKVSLLEVERTDILALVI